MIDPCKELRESSSYVRRWLTRQPGVKEESLTDWLLYDVSDRLPFVHYVSFSRHQEARETGADWEWWILLRGNYFRIRVQAKKVSATKDNYPELARTNSYGLQIDKLLDDARIANAIPLYALYSTETGHSMCSGQPHMYEDGVFLAGATHLYADFIKGGRKPVSSSELLNRSNPFSCFACCPLTRKLDGGTLSYFERYYRAEVHPDGEDSDVPRGTHTLLPDYVSLLLEHSAEGIPDWWEGEFRSSLLDFNGILVYDYRNENT
jgi:hypothetical protein